MEKKENNKPVLVHSCIGGEKKRNSIAIIVNMSHGVTHVVKQQSERGVLGSRSPSACLVSVLRPSVWLG